MLGLEKENSNILPLLRGKITQQSTISCSILENRFAKELTFGVQECQDDKLES